MLGDGEEVEDAAAKIVDDHHGQAQIPSACQLLQCIDVVDRSDIADDQRCRGAHSMAKAGCRAHHTIDACGASICHGRMWGQSGIQGGLGEEVEISNRHRARDLQMPSWVKQARYSVGDERLREGPTLGEECIHHLLSRIGEALPKCWRARISTQPSFHQSLGQSLKRARNVMGDCVVLIHANWSVRNANVKLGLGCFGESVQSRRDEWTTHVQHDIDLQQVSSEQWAIQ
mmetsp:Transcript_98242/g.282481  ORF Transcript_98242/g.282481 Transcript_98242/m.282481 type:complete len:230 (-) Transcript_98242:702-1391(-)